MALSSFLCCYICQTIFSSAVAVASPYMEQMKNFCWRLGICDSIISKDMSRSCSSNSDRMSTLALKIAFQPF